MLGIMVTPSRHGVWDVPESPTTGSGLSGSRKRVTLGLDWASRTFSWSPLAQFPHRVHNHSKKPHCLIVWVYWGHFNPNHHNIQFYERKILMKNKSITLLGMKKLWSSVTPNCSFCAHCCIMTKVWSSKYPQIWWISHKRHDSPVGIFNSEILIVKRDVTIIVYKLLIFDDTYIIIHRPIHYSPSEPLPRMEEYLSSEVTNEVNLSKNQQINIYTTDTTLSRE